ncbi:BES1-interacting Myc-like protein 2 [Euphorbia peplus]|nr:BES1-interacting Myc-like protein 2 [Euphorbia peplus]
MILVQGLFEAFRMQGKGNQNQDEYEYDDEDFGCRKDGPSSNMNKYGKNSDKASAIRSKHPSPSENGEVSDHKRDTASFLLEVWQFLFSGGLHELCFVLTAVICLGSAADLIKIAMINIYSVVVGVGDSESSFAFATKIQMPNSLAVLAVDPSLVKEAA